MRYSTEYERAVHDAGFVIEAKHRGKHIKLFATHPRTGEVRHRIMIPLSPSDHRGLVKFRADLKRLLREPA